MVIRMHDFRDIENRLAFAVHGSQGENRRVPNRPRILIKHASGDGSGRRHFDSKSFLQLSLAEWKYHSASENSALAILCRTCDPPIRAATSL